MATLYIQVYEIEHSGDSADAASDIREAGGSIQGHPVCDFEGEESAMFKVEVEDKRTFLNRYAKTDTFEFSNMVGR